MAAPIDYNPADRKYNISLLHTLRGYNFEAVDEG